jgi:hypothetical protein
MKIYLEPNSKTQEHYLASILAEASLLKSIPRDYIVHPSDGREAVEYEILPC